MNKKALCELFKTPNTKDGFQLAMHKLGLRLSSREWRLNGLELLYMGFRFRKNVVSFVHLKSIETGVCSCKAFEITIDEAIDCISGNLGPLLNYKP